MAHSIEKNVQVKPELNTDIVTFTFGNTTIRAYTQGSTNEFDVNGSPVTANDRALYEKVVAFHDLNSQRGANPFMDPAGRYSKKFAQPGAHDIHGVFAGMKWTIQEVNDTEGYIQFYLPAEEWKNELINYYVFAARKPEMFSEQKQSLIRLIKATLERFPGNMELQGDLFELLSLLEAVDDNLGKVDELISKLIEAAYPGSANLTRRVQVVQRDEKITEFIDQVWIENVGTTAHKSAPGFHTYFKAGMKEIADPPWLLKKVPAHFDDNLNEVKVRIIDQRDSEGRIIVIIPEGKLQNIDANQIIYKDEKRLDLTEVALECWYQRGDEIHFPDRSLSVEPGETVNVGVRIIIINGAFIPDDIQAEIDRVNGVLKVKEG